MLLVARCEHALARRRLRAADLSGREAIQREPTSNTRALVTACLQSEKIQVRSVMTPGDPIPSGAGFEISALSKRLVADDLAQGALETGEGVQLAGRVGSTASDAGRKP